MVRWCGGGVVVCVPTYTQQPWCGRRVRPRRDLASKRTCRHLLRSPRRRQRRVFRAARGLYPDTSTKMEDWQIALCLGCGIMGSHTGHQKPRRGVPVLDHRRPWFLLPGHFDLYTESHEGGGGRGEQRCAPCIGHPALNPTPQRARDTAIATTSRHLGSGLTNEVASEGQSPLGLRRSPVSRHPRLSGGTSAGEAWMEDRGTHDEGSRQGVSGLGSFRGVGGVAPGEDGR